VQGKDKNKKEAYEEPDYCHAKIPVAFHRMMKPVNGQTAPEKHLTKPNDDMITKVIARPNPFYTSVTLEVACEHSRHTIVRMTDAESRIVKLFSWYLVKGSNVTTITEMGAMHPGGYVIDILDNEGNSLFNTALTKA
jgi:hypothetical protein